MHSDKYGRQILTESDLCELYLQNPDRILKNVTVDSIIPFNEDLEIENKPTFSEYKPLSISIEEYDNNNQTNWYVPEEYKNLDIAKYVLDLCKSDDELQRVGDELLKYQEFGMFDLFYHLEVSAIYYIHP
jgi:hypothetical protein